MTSERPRRHTTIGQLDVLVGPLDYPGLDSNDVRHALHRRDQSRISAYPG
jgi:hypothetical protein